MKNKPVKLTSEEIKSEQLHPSWTIVQNKKLEKEYTFPDFKTALTFTIKVGALAEELNHHPDIFLTWGKVKLTISTHSVGGLSNLDFALVKKIEATNCE
jgi:4a-hydroxytetrahydrobiopterin dehydratase